MYGRHYEICENVSAWREDRVNFIHARAQEVKLALFSIISGQRSTELRWYFCTLVEKTRRTSHTCSNGRTRLRVRFFLDSGLQSSR